MLYVRYYIRHAMQLIKLPALIAKFMIFAALIGAIAACADKSESSGRPIGAWVAISGRAQGSCHLFEGTQEAVCVESYYGGLVRSDHRQMTSADQRTLSSAAREMCDTNNRYCLIDRQWVNPLFHFSATEGCEPIPLLSAYCVKDSYLTLVAGEVIWSRITMQVSSLVEESMRAHCLNNDDPDVIVRWLTPEEFQALPPMELPLAPRQGR